MPLQRGRFARALAVGLAGGLLSGLFGVGGGILIVPGLVFLLGMPQRSAHATSLAAIVPIALAGVAGYALNDLVDWLAAGILAAGGAVGATLGTRALRRVSDRALRWSFAVFLVLAAAALPIEVTSGAGVRLTLPVAVALVAAGVLAGALAGLLGVGGGIVLVPALVLLTGAGVDVAKGTSLAVIIPTALVGTALNLRAGTVDLRAAATAGLGGVAASFGAALLSVRLDPLVAAVLFGLLLLGVAARMLLLGGEDRARRGGYAEKNRS
jgi:uncharacterized membrane protein YfcA